MDSSVQLRESRSGFVIGDKFDSYQVAIPKVRLIQTKLNKEAILNNDDNNNVAKLSPYKSAVDRYKQESCIGSSHQLFLRSHPTKKSKNLGIKRPACRRSPRISKPLAVKEELRRVQDLNFSLPLRQHIERHLHNNVNVKDENGKNALHLLYQNNSSKNLTAKTKFLIQSGIEVNEKDKDGQNALHYLCRYNRKRNLVKAIQILIQSGIDVNAKDNDGRNALYILVSSKTNKDLKSIAFRFLIRHGVQVRRELGVISDVYQEFFNENEDCGKICFDFLVRTQIRLGWHNDCESCKEILSITECLRARLQHHQKFGNCYRVFHLLMKHLEKWAEGNQCGESQLRSNPTKWLREKAEQYRQDEPSCKKHFELMADVSDQIEDGCDSSQFNCDNYELYLRSMYSIAKMIDSKQSMGQIEWLFLLPFDYPIDYSDETDTETKRAKAEWDKTLSSWAHEKNNKDYGRSLKEDANDGFFLPEELKYKCHGGL